MNSVIAFNVNGVDLSRSAKIPSHFSRACKFVRGSLLAFNFLIVLCVGSVFAAEIPEATIVHRPGDTVRVIATFKEPVSLQFGNLRFALQSQLPEGQKAFSTFFDLASVHKLSDKEFELTGRIGENVASGTYRAVIFNGTNSENLSRVFNIGATLPVITVCIRNDRRGEFSDLKSLEVVGRQVAQP